MLKFVKHVRSRLLSSAAAGFIAALAMGGTVVAITDTQFLYSPAKTGYYSIHPMDLGPGVYHAEYAIEYPSGKLTDINGSCYSTGVNLPQGARITQLAVWFSSPAGPANNPYFQFWQTNLANGITTSLIGPSIIEDDTNTRKLGVLPIAGGSSPVSNTGFSYGFGVCPGPSGAFYSARIAYTYTNAGD